MKAGAYDPKRYDVGTDSPDSPDISSNDDDSSPPPRTVKLLPRAPRAAGAAVATTAQPQPPMHNSAHPDYAAAATIRGNTGNTVSTKTLYATDWAVFTRFCVKYNWDPCSFSLELAELFAGHISNRTPPPAKITPYFTAMNDHYVHHRPSLGRPWAGGLMTELRKTVPILDQIGTTVPILDLDHWCGTYNRYLASIRYYRYIYSCRHRSS